MATQLLNIQEYPMLWDTAPPNPPKKKNISLPFSLILDIHLIGNQISRGDEVYHAKTSGREVHSKGNKIHPPVKTADRYVTRPTFIELFTMYLTPVLNFFMHIISFKITS